MGVGLGIKHAHQGSALIHVYLDGSVLLAHGSTEMGQGLYTKTIQVRSLRNVGFYKMYNVRDPVFK